MENCFKKYASLHNHSMHSYQDGLGTAEQWILAAKEKGIVALAITNHASAGDLVEFYRLGKKYDYPVILGTEFYVVDDRKNRDTKNRYGHLNLWAKNAVGYKNLCILNSLSWTEDRFYYKPRIDFEDLKQYHEGLICGSACVGSPIAKSIINGKITAETDTIILFLKDIFKDDFYLEVQPADLSHEWDREKQTFYKITGDNPQELINRAYQEISKKYDIKIIATADAHMIDPSDKRAQDVQIINSNHNKKDAWHFYETYFLPSYDEILDLFLAKHAYLLDEEESVFTYLQNTLEVAEKCKNLELEFKPLLPIIPDSKGKQSLYEILEKEKIIELTAPAIRERIDFEIKTLCDNGKIDLTNYFLLLYDVVQYCKTADILVGPGRGSAVGSLLVFGMGLTKINPLKYELSFERFINSARIEQHTLPDIDLDFSDPTKVKQYLLEKYGVDYVASIGTIQTLQFRSALKDTLRVLEPEIPAQEVNFLTKSIVEDKEAEFTKESFLKQIAAIPKLKELVLANKDIAKVTYRLIGQARQRGTHAAAVVVSPIPLKEIVPLALNNGTWTTQYAMGDVEHVGLIKYDILGLNTLNVINSCLKSVQANHGVKLTIEEIIDEKSEDLKVFEHFQKGKNYSVFQFNTEIADEICLKTPIHSIEDLAKITALGRPGTLDVGMDKVYIRRINGREPIEYVHESLKEVLKDTCGILLYQEQVMKAFQILGGFNQVEADEIRRGMGKKKYELLEKYKVKFIENAVLKYSDIDQDRAQKIWKLIEANAGYSFNKCLSSECIVETENGERLLLEIKKGDKVKSFNRKLQKFEFSEVLDVIDQGNVELYEILTEDGCEIKCSLNHKFLCEDGETHMLKDILENDIEILCEI